MNHARSIFFSISRGNLSTVVVLLSPFLILMACCSTVSDTKAANVTEEISFVAEVRWIPLEGGFYGLVADNGRKFLPLNLPEEFRKQGLKVQVRGQIKEDIATMHMWGKPFEISEINISK